jgi:orotate phosphoribosyltransferase
VNYRSVADLNDDIIAWLPRLPRNLEVIAGVPRSGLLAGNLLALYLNLPLTDVERLLEGRTMSAGPRYRGMGPSELLKTPRNVLVVDDSSLSGRAMRQVRDRVRAADLPHRVLYAAVYVADAGLESVDLWCRYLPPPRCFEWNIMHHAMLERAAVDMDGVLSEPAASPAGGELALIDAEPIFVPARKIGLVVACRPEAYRAITEDWLHEHGISYDQLRMMDLPPGRPPQVQAEFLSEVYKRNDAALFIEHWRPRARAIFRDSGKPVLCTQDWRMLRPGLFATGVSELKHFAGQFMREPANALREAKWRLAELRHRLRAVLQSP